MRAAGSYMEGKKGGLVNIRADKRHAIRKVSPGTISILKSTAELPGQQYQPAPHGAYLSMPEIDAKYNSKDRFGKNNSAMASAKSYQQFPN